MAMRLQAWPTVARLMVVRQFEIRRLRSTDLMGPDSSPAKTIHHGAHRQWPSAQTQPWRCLTQ